MNKLDQIYLHSFTMHIGNIEMKIIDEQNCTESEIYVNNVSFYFVHFLSLLSQIENAVELLNNYAYSSNSKISRADHLTYNVENYMIRSISITDRLLQLINVIYYLKIDESKVNFKKVIGHNDIINSPLASLYTELRDILAQYSCDRNSVVHRHSFISTELYRLQKLYHPVLTKNYISVSSDTDIKNFKYVRSQTMKKYTSDIKSNFKTANDASFNIILQILDILQDQYKFNIEKLQMANLT
ncbi:Cthe_2314 family HEPN domain-containing protein [Flavobacterium ginsenosidimutans]|uniref:Cthe_2314 family HEPN domain-containing protein n=1 Tax=Flavobacterium ginsenosidimutans TaxID=687844 RepID=UPI003D9533C4